MTLNNKSKDNIIKETVKLIQKKGYAGTSIQEIIKKSKAPKGSMYYYFPAGKDAMILAGVEQINQEFQKKFKNSILPLNNLSDILNALITMFNSKIRIYGTPSFRMTLLALETIGEAPEVAKKCCDVLTDWKKITTRAIISLGINEKASINICDWFFTTLQGAISASVIYDDITFMNITNQSIKLIKDLSKEELESMFI